MKAEPGKIGITTFFFSTIAVFLILFLTSQLLVPMSMVTVALASLAVGGVLGVFLSTISYFMIPAGIRNILRSVETGFLLVAMGSDNKVRFLPAVSDGFVLRPIDEPYKSKYVFAADGESTMVLHNGGGVQTALVYMGYMFPIKGSYAAAVMDFVKKGFKDVNELKTAVELARAGTIDDEIERLKNLLEEIKEASEEEIYEAYNISKEDMISRIVNEIAFLEGVKKAVEEVGSPDRLVAIAENTVIKAKDLIRYLFWKHHPTDVQRIIDAEVMALMSRLPSWERVKRMIPWLLLIGIIVIIAAIAYAIISGGGGGPASIPTGPLPTPEITPPNATTTPIPTATTTTPPVYTTVTHTVLPTTTPAPGGG